MDIRKVIQNKQKLERSNITKGFDLQKGKAQPVGTINKYDEMKMGDGSWKYVGKKGHDHPAAKEARGSGEYFHIEHSRRDNHQEGKKNLESGEIVIHHKHGDNSGAKDRLQENFKSFPNQNPDVGPEGHVLVKVGPGQGYTETAHAIMTKERAELAEKQGKATIVGGYDKEGNYSDKEVKKEISTPAPKEVDPKIAERSEHNKRQIDKIEGSKKSILERLKRDGYASSHPVHQMVKDAAKKTLQDAKLVHSKLGKKFKMEVDFSFDHKYLSYSGEISLNKSELLEKNREGWKEFHKKWEYSSMDSFLAEEAGKYLNPVLGTKLGGSGYSYNSSYIGTSYIAGSYSQGRVKHYGKI